jgi:hypothetical protein
MEYRPLIKIKAKTKDSNNLYVQIKEPLVTSSKETIKNILHEVKKQFGGRTEILNNSP